MLNTPLTFQQTCLQYRLEHQSREIEDVLRRYTSPQTAVTEGEVGSTAIHYHASLAAPLPYQTCQAALTQTLKTPVTLTAVPTGCTVTVPRPRPPVSLLELLLSYAPQTAVLGLDEMGQAVPFTLPAAGHTLLSGQRGSGKTALLQTLVVTLALTQPLQVLLIQGSGSEALDSLKGLPPAYRLGTVITDATQASRALAGLGGRRAGQVPVLVVIDEVEKLLLAGKTAVLQPLVHLLTQPWVSLVLTTTTPDSDLLLCLADAFTVHLAGKTADDDLTPGGSARLTSQLLGQGDFLLSTSESPLPHYFQAAYADRYEVGFLLSQLATLSNGRNGRICSPALSRPPAALCRPVV